MSNNRKRDLKRALTEMYHPFPDDDLIVTYPDFLKVRDYLKYYQFNASVFHRLISLANDCWMSEKRVNRLSLLQSLKYYLYNGQSYAKKDYYSRSLTTYHNQDLRFETRILIFELFKKTFENSQYISYKQIDEAREICNFLLFNIGLSANEEAWLCTHTGLSEKILNRVLRYPVLSETISNWAKNVYEQNELVTRRAEVLSFIIDADPTFEISTKTLIDDFEQLNKIDREAIKQYEEEIEAQEIVEREFGDMLYPAAESQDFFSDYSRQFRENYPELKLSRRFYPTPLDNSKREYAKIPDFSTMEKDFHENLERIQKVTMIWGIGYSRLDNLTKLELLKKYYDEHTYYSIFRVAQKTQNTALIEWLLSVQS